MTNQQRVLNVIYAAPAPVRGWEIASTTGLSHKQVADALFWLRKKKLICSDQRKKYARWKRPKDTFSGAQIARFFDSMCRA